MRRKIGPFQYAFICLAMGLSFQSWSHANSCQKPRGGGGGHEVPTPFENVNRKFELADGELYSFSGEVVFLSVTANGHDRLKPFLKISPDDYPWLSNAKRVQFPFYVLEGANYSWKRWEGQEVDGVFRAHGRIVVGKDGAEYVITLEPVLDSRLN